MPGRARAAGRRGGKRSIRHAPMTNCTWLPPTRRRAPCLRFILHPSSFILLLSLFFGSGVLLSYLAVAVLLGVGTLAAWAWKLPRGPARADRRPATIEVVENTGRSAGPKTPVGRITQTVGCRWTNMMITKETPTKDRLTVSLGARYIVDAGLLEITYYSGARWFSRGRPCTRLTAEWRFSSHWRRNLPLQDADEGKGSDGSKSGIPGRRGAVLLRSRSLRRHFGPGYGPTPRHGSEPQG